MRTVILTCDRCKTTPVSELRQIDFGPRPMPELCPACVADLKAWLGDALPEPEPTPVPELPT